MDLLFLQDIQKMHLKMQSIADKGFNDNHYVANRNDNYNVDPTNLTKEQQEEVTEYAADLINQIRNMFGEPNVSANTHMIDFANTIANDQYKDGIKFGHDNQAISDTFDNDSSLTWEGENLAGWVALPSFDSGKCTMNTVKEGVYNAINNFLFNDSDEKWGHAMGTINTDGRENQGLGVAIDKFGNIHFDFGTGSISQYNIADSQAADLKKLEEQQSKLQSELDNANSVVEQDQNQVNQAQNAYNQAKSSADSANQALNNANTALANAQQDVKTAQTAYNQANDKLNSLRDKLAKDEAQLANDEKQLSNLENTMNDYKNAPAKLDQAKKALTDAQTALNDAKQALANAKTTLNNDRNTLAQKQKALANANSRLARAEQAYNQASSATTEMKTTNVSHPMNTAEIGNNYTLRQHNSNVVKADVVTPELQAAEIKTTDKKMESSMPQTGEQAENTSLFGEIALGISAVLASFVLGYKRKRN